MKYIKKQGKSIFYTLIILFLCIVDQRRGSAPGQVQFVFVNLAGTAICLLMFSTYKLKEFLRWTYWLWTILYGIGVITITCLQNELISYKGQWYTALINIWLIGILFIRMSSKFLFEGWRPRFSLKAIVIYGCFIVFAWLSKNDSFWPGWYMVLFTMLYLTDFSQEDCKRIFDAIPNGIIIGFFLIQGLAFVFRPYDNLRYHGLYANSNINALFYTLVYCAFLGKYCMYFAKDKEVKYCRIRRIINLLFCGAMWTFVCLTICRTAMISMAVVTAFAGLYCLCKVRKYIIKNAIGMVLGLVISIVLCAPITYGAVRYLPAIFQHPIWYGGEYSPYDVHSFDPIDSPKYISWQQVIDGVLGRWQELELSGGIVQDEHGQTVYIVSSSSDIDKIVANLVQSQMLRENKQLVGSANVRIDIFTHYYEKLNMWGHLNNEDGLWLNGISWIPHAHNLFLQMAFWFGIPAAIFFAIWLGYNIITAARKAFGKNRDARMAIILLFYINIVVFGMLEVVWVTGQLSFTLLFLLPLFLFGGKAAIVEK